jgi:hypothetical protein
MSFFDPFFWVKERMNLGLSLEMLFEAKTKERASLRRGLQEKGLMIMRPETLYDLISTSESA